MTIGSMSKWFKSQGDNKVTWAWFLCLIAYVSFRFANISAPELTNAFVTITGIFVGNLGIKKSKESAEEKKEIKTKVEHAAHLAEAACDAVTESLPTIIEDPNTGEVRPQKPPRISREGDNNG